MRGRRQRRSVSPPRREPAPRFGAAFLLAAALLLPVHPACGRPGVPSGDDPGIVVIPQDGRPPQPVPVVREGAASFLPLVALTRALGVPFSWNPQTYRGSIETDSTETRFTLGSPVLTHGTEGRQLDHEIRYAEAGVLIPLDYLSLLEEEWNAGRPVAWSPGSGTLGWGIPAVRSSDLRFSRIGHRATCRIAGNSPPGSRLLWSPLGGLEVLLEGWSVDPGSLPDEAAGEMLALRGVRGWGSGSRVRFDVATVVRGLTDRYDERSKEWDLLATASREEEQRGGFHSLERIAIERPSRGGPVVLACSVDPATDPAEVTYVLRDLAEQTAEILSTRLGTEAVVLEGDDPIKMAGRANGYDARCVVGLRIDRYDAGVDRIQVWLPVARHRWHLLGRADGDSLLLPRPPLWSETPALSEGASRKLATTVSSHLESTFGRGTVRMGSRPSRWLEGILLPSVLVYPAVGDDPGSLKRLMDPEDRGRMAHALAFGISEAMATDPLEGGVR